MNFILLLVITMSLKAALWGFVSGLALIIGAALGYLTKIRGKIIAYIMAFGSGVLISALAFDLMDEAYHRGGFVSTAIGFISGAIVYSGANYFINKKGAKHRKRSGNQQPSEEKQPGSGLAIAIGALMDGIPESIAIGVSMIKGGSVSMAAVIAIFLSNLPEGMSSSSGMKKAGRKAQYIFTIWIVIAILSSLASLSGYLLFRNLSDEVIAATMAIAAGAILAMLSDTMIPEAFEKGHDLVGLITVIGFLTAFIVTKMV